MLVSADRQAAAHQLSPRFGLSASQILTNPNILVGNGGQMVADPRCRRQELSTSYRMAPEHFVEALAPVAEPVAES